MNDDTELSSEDLRAAILVALATGWKPARPADDTFDDDEQPTAQMGAI